MQKWRLVIFLAFFVSFVGFSAYLAATNDDDVEALIPPPVTFNTISRSYEERIDFELIPDTNWAASYVVSYQVLRDGLSLEEVADQRFDAVSAQRPIEIAIEMREHTSCRLTIKVEDLYGREVLNETMKAEVKL